MQTQEIYALMRGRKMQEMQAALVARHASKALLDACLAHAVEVNCMQGVVLCLRMGAIVTQKHKRLAIRAGNTEVFCALVTASM